MSVLYIILGMWLVGWVVCVGKRFVEDFGEGRRVLVFFVREVLG